MHPSPLSHFPRSVQRTTLHPQKLAYLRTLESCYEGWLIFGFVWSSLLSSIGASILVINVLKVICGAHGGYAAGIGVVELPHDSRIWAADMDFDSTAHLKWDLHITRSSPLEIVF